MSKTLSVDDVPGKKLYLFHTPDCAVWVQGRMWFGVTDSVDVVPCMPYGLCAVDTNIDSVGRAQPAYGFLLFRPASLTLKMPKDTELEVLSVPPVTMQNWYKLGEPWKHLKARATAPGGNGW